MKSAIKSTKSMALATVMVLFYGCASAPNYPAPPLAGSIKILETPLPLDKDIGSTTIINNGPIYLFQTEGGSIAAGLLGGYLLNSHLVSQKTKEITSALSPEAPSNISKKIEAAINQNNPQLLKVGNDPLYTLQSAILIKADHNATVRATLITKASTASKSAEWSKSYFYLFTKTITRSQLEAGNDGFKELIDGINLEMNKATYQTGRVISDDLSGKLHSGSKLRITSNDLSPMPNITFIFDGLKIGKIDDRDVVRVDGTPGMITFPTVDGIHILSSTQYAVEK